VGSGGSSIESSATPEAIRLALPNTIALLEILRAVRAVVSDAKDCGTRSSQILLHSV
jgi:hypothetical protein